MNGTKELQERFAAFLRQIEEDKKEMQLRGSRAKRAFPPGYTASVLPFPVGNGGGAKTSLTKGGR